MVLFTVISQSRTTALFCVTFHVFLIVGDKDLKYVQYVDHSTS